MKKRKIPNLASSSFYICRLPREIEVVRKRFQPPNDSMSQDSMRITRAHFCRAACSRSKGAMRSRTREYRTLAWTQAASGAAAAEARLAVLASKDSPLFASSCSTAFRLSGVIFLASKDLWRKGTHQWMNTSIVNGKLTDGIDFYLLNGTFNWFHWLVLLHQAVKIGGGVRALPLRVCAHFGERKRLGETFLWSETSQ